MRRLLTLQIQASSSTARATTISCTVYKGEVGTILSVGDPSPKVHPTLEIEFVSTVPRLSTGMEKCKTTVSIGQIPKQAMVGRATTPRANLTEFWEMMHVLYTHGPAYRHEEFRTKEDLLWYLQRHPSFACAESMDRHFGNCMTFSTDQIALLIKGRGLQK